jgi:acetyl esterase/lipase
MQLSNLLFLLNFPRYFKIQRDLSYGPDARNQLDIYEPKEINKDTPIIFFWYGGSWSDGSKNYYEFIGASFARKGFITVIPDYRLYPQVKFPEFIKDGAAAIAFVNKIYPNNKNIFVMGHSAGAHIAALLALDSNYLKEIDIPLDLIKGFIGLSGPYDFKPGPNIKPIFEGIDPKHWQPIELVTGRTVQMLLFQGRYDQLVSHQNAIKLAKKVKQNGGRATLKIYRRFEHFTIILPLAGLFTWLAPIRKQIMHFIKDNSN